MLIGCSIWKRWSRWVASSTAWAWCRSLRSGIPGYRCRPPRRPIMVAGDVVRPTVANAAMTASTWFTAICGSSRFCQTLAVLRRCHIARQGQLPPASGQRCTCPPAPRPRRSKGPRRLGHGPECPWRIDGGARSHSDTGTRKSGEGQAFGGLVDKLIHAQRSTRYFSRAFRRFGAVRLVKDAIMPTAVATT